MSDDLIEHLTALLSTAIDVNERLTNERDRLRKELEKIADDCEAEYPPSHGAIKYAARMALKGE